MIYKVILILCLITSTLSGINRPVNSDPFVTASHIIDHNSLDLQALNNKVVVENQDFKTLSASYPLLVEGNKLSQNDNMFSTHPDSPLGIGGFWWGFGFGFFTLYGGILGMLVVYLSMDSGEARKEQVRNALYGCIAAGLVWTAIILVLVATLN